MLFSGSIESNNHNGAIEKFEKRSDKELHRIFLHLYGFMLLRESEKPQWGFEKFEKCTDK